MAALVLVGLESVLIGSFPHLNLVSRQVLLVGLLAGFHVQHVPLVILTFEVLHLRHHGDRLGVRYFARHLADLGAVRLSHELLVFLGLDLLLEFHISQLFLAN